MPKDAPVNIGAPLGEPTGAHQRVSGMQAKLHRWAAADAAGGIELFNPESVAVTRYRWRANTIPNPWTLPDHA